MSNSLLTASYPSTICRQRRQVPRAVLVAPAGLRHEPLRLAPDGAARQRRRPFADRAGHHHVVAEELELVPEALLQLRQLGIVLVLQEVHLQPDERAAFTVDREPGVVHAVLIEVREDLIRVQRSRRREQHLVQMRGQADAGRIRHHVERAALLVFERLHPAQEEQCARGRTAHRAGGRDDAGLGDADLLDVGMGGRRRIGGVEDLLAEAVGHARSREALVEQHRPIGDRIVELLQSRVTMLGPLVRVPAAHRRDPLAFGDALPPRGERLLDLSDRGRVLEDRVIAGAIGEAHAVDMAFDDARHDRAPLQIDHLRAGLRGDVVRRADRSEAAVADGHGIRDGVARVHRVDAAVDERQVLRRPAGGRSRLDLRRGKHGLRRRSRASGGDSHTRPCRCTKESSPRHAAGVFRMSVS